MYLRVREDEVSESTLNSHRYRLNPLTEWANQHDDVEYLSDLSPRTLYEYRKWRKDDGDLKDITLHTQLTTVRTWLKKLGTLELVDEDLHRRIEIPDVNEEQEVRNVMLSADRAEEIDTYLSKFEYGSRLHVIWTLLYGVGIRIGGVRGLDLSDVDFEDQSIQFRHRPEGRPSPSHSGGLTVGDDDYHHTETGEKGVTTPLKNAAGGERIVSMSDDIKRVLCDYVKMNRRDTVEGNGREPLVTTPQGRISLGTIRREVYRLTQPCQIGKDCPHGETKEDCSVAGYTDSPSKCPSIVNPHAIRKLVIVEYRREEIPDKFITDRCNVSQRVIDKNYDMRSESEQMEQRRDYFE